MENLTIQHTAFARWYIFDRMYKINRMDGPGAGTSGKKTAIMLVRLVQLCGCC
jgi:hypothetical protein